MIPMRGSGRDYQVALERGVRTPQTHPYSFDEHMIWGDQGESCVHSDRMWQWDREKARAAFKGRGNQMAQPLLPNEAQEVIDAYYGKGEYTCVGYGLGCNQANGYPYGIFYIRKRASPSSDGSE